MFTVNRVTLLVCGVLVAAVTGDAAGMPRNPGRRGREAAQRGSNVRHLVRVVATSGSGSNVRHLVRVVATPGSGSNVRHLVRVVATPGREGTDGRVRRLGWGGTAKSRMAGLAWPMIGGVDGAELRLVSLYSGCGGLDLGF